MDSSQLDPSQLPAHFDVRADSLSPLPTELRSGLIFVTIFGFLSFFASTILFILLTWRICKWLQKARTINQFVILIYNLVLADIQQSVAFVINAKWLVENGITVETSSCWAQGWFVSTGDLASGAFCFFIAIHTLLTLVFNYRMSNLVFSFAIIGTWAGVYALALVGIALHPTDVYVRAVSWCWMNTKYGDLRLWLHYFWIFVFEFGTVGLYIVIYAVIQIRIKSNYYANSIQAQYARNAAKLMIVYPMIYVICTLPLASVRMISMANNSNVSFTWFCFAGAMITSNGWLDVLLYSLTRRIMLFSDEPPSDSCGVETFTLPFSGNYSEQFGNKTTCEYVGGPASEKTPGSRWRQKGDLESGKGSDLTSYSSTVLDASSPSTQFSTSPKARSDILTLEVTTTTTWEVRSEPLVEEADVEEARITKMGVSPTDKSPFDFDYKPSGRR